MTSNNNQHALGKLIKVLKLDENSKIIVESDVLDRIFLHPKVKNRKVVVLSIVGGKSFLLSDCLRFLYENYPSIRNPNNRSDETQAPQEFDAMPAIRMWSDVFLHNNSISNEKIAIVVVVTPELFFNETSPSHVSSVFNFVTLISSIQLLNLVQITDEDQLKLFQFVTDFAKLASSRENQDFAGKTFQNLLLFIKDWGITDSHGLNSGRVYLKEVLESQPDQTSEMKSLRENLLSSFDSVKCSLMPCPEEFDALIASFLFPMNLALKKINGKAVEGFEMREYFEMYSKHFQTDALLSPQSCYELTVNKQMNFLIETCIDLYKMYIDDTQDYLNQENVQSFDEAAKKLIRNTFEREKIGNSSHASKYKELLEAQIEETYEELLAFAEDVPVFVPSKLPNYLISCFQCE